MEWFSYVTGRTWDIGGYLFREHRPGWVRRIDIPAALATNPATEHPVGNLSPRAIVDNGILHIHERPSVS